MSKKAESEESRSTNKNERGRSAPMTTTEEDAIIAD